MKKLLEEHWSGCAIELRQEGGDLALVLVGRAEGPVAESLRQVLDRADQAIERQKATDVTVDFRRLSFLNSACFKDFVVWLSRVKERPTDRQYRLKFVSSSEVRWQRASLYSLSCFASDLVTIIDT